MLEVGVFKGRRLRILASQSVQCSVLEVEETIIHPTGATGTSGLSSECSRETLTTTVSNMEDDVPHLLLPASCI